MLFEQYRPRSLDGIIGQDKAVSRARLVLNRPTGTIGRSFWISGNSGQGKTTLALAIARESADEFNIVEIDAGQLTVSELAELENEMRYKALGTKAGRVYIVNEAHGLRKPVIRQLLVLLERLPSHVTIIFTTTKAGQAKLFDDNEDSEPFLSRCAVITLTNQGLNKAFASRAQEIARQEQLDGKPIEAYEALAARCKNNFRMMLSEIESGAMLD